MICFFPFLHLVGSTTAWFIHLIWFACRFSSFFPSPLSSSSSFNRLACTFFINLVSQWWYIYDFVAKTESHCVFVFRVSDIRHENTIITYIRLTFIRSFVRCCCYYVFAALALEFTVLKCSMIRLILILSLSLIPAIVIKYWSPVNLSAKQNSRFVKKGRVHSHCAAPIKCSFLSLFAVLS